MKTSIKIHINIINKLNINIYKLLIDNIKIHIDKNFGLTC